MSWGSWVCVLVPAWQNPVRCQRQPKSITASCPLEGLPGQWDLWSGQKRGPILLVQQAWNFLLCLKVNEWDMNTEEGKTQQIPPTSFFKQKLRLVTILAYLWAQSHRIFEKRTVLENSGCVLNRAAAQHGELPRRTVDNSKNPIPGRPLHLEPQAPACSPRHPTSGKRTHSGLSAAQGLVNSHWPGKFFCSQLSENTTLS